MLAGAALHQADRAARRPPVERRQPGSAPVKTSAAQEAANARIAGVPHVDLLGGQGLGAFKVSGDARKVDMTTVPDHRDSRSTKRCGWRSRTRRTTSGRCSSRQ